VALGVLGISVWALLFAQDSGSSWLLVYLAPTLVPLQIALRLRSAASTPKDKAT
jgi:hypothetical protein